jgi:electron transport complex protein RnfG
VVNGLTKDTIAENELAEINAARAAVLGDYVFKQVDTDLSGYVTIKDVYAGYDGDAVKGYVYEIQSKGYASVPVSISLGIDTSGAIVGLNITAHAETKGIGTDAQVPFLKSFVGLNAEGLPSQTVAGVDGMTGATYSTNAVKNGVEEALSHFAANFLGGEVNGQ